MKTRLKALTNDYLSWVSTLHGWTKGLAVLGPPAGLLLAFVLVGSALGGGGDSEEMEGFDPNQPNNPRSAVSLLDTPTPGPSPTSTRVIPPTATFAPAAATTTATPIPPTSTPEPTATKPPTTGGGGGGGGGGTQPPPPPPPPRQPTCSASAGVSNANPPKNSSVLVFGKLTCDGAGVGGAVMAATWHYANGNQTCSDTTAPDGTASCSRSAGSGSAQVKIDVCFAYSGQNVCAQTGFTPK